jgi:hypothetical protein
MSRKDRRARRTAKAKGWQSPLELEAVRELDPEGRIVVHHRVVDTLARMHKAGTITHTMVDAGRTFERQFILAQLDPLRAPDIGRIPGSGREADPGDTTLGARRRIHSALSALGGHDGAMGSVVWHVLGCGCSLREWTLRQGWNGRQLRAEQATGVLIAALDLLAVHYGLARRKSVA